MIKEKINPDNVAKPAAPYTNVVKVSQSSEMIYLSGISANGEGGIVGKGDILKQTEQVAKNIIKTLEAVGAGPENIVMTTTYVISDYLFEFLKVGGANVLFSALDNPADTLVGVAELAGRPGGALIEVNVIAQK